MNSDTLLPPKEVATRLGVSVYSVRRWCRDGQLASVKLGTGARSHVRIPQSEVERVQAGGLK